MKKFTKPLFATTLILAGMSSIAPSLAHERGSFNFRSSNIITGNNYRMPRYLGYSRRAKTRTRTVSRRNTRRQKSYRAERRAAFRAAFTDE